MSAVLTVDDLGVAFDRRDGDPVPVLDRVGFEIGAGEILALVGESGSGKSMTALAVTGLLPARARVTQGAIRFDGQDLLGMSEPDRRRLRGARIGMVFQEPMTALNPVLTIGRQMTEALSEHEGLSAGAARARALAMLGRVGLPGDAPFLKHYPHELSGGMRQRVMIAMAMMLGPALLIADEPTTALDVTVQAQVLRLLCDLVRATGSSLLLITHDMGVVAEVADRVVVLQRGRVVETQRVEILFAAPAQPYTRALLAAVPRLDGPGRAAPAAAAEPILTLEGIVKSYAARGLFGAARRAKAVDDVSLGVGRGETLALVGESGSGKSTLGRAAARLVDVDAGRIVVAGQDLTQVTGRRLRAARSTIQMIFQDPFASLDPRFTLLSSIVEPMLVKHSADRQHARNKAFALMDRVGLPRAMSERLPHEVSGGQRQRVTIARALAAGPSIIVADEPTSALDVSVQAQVLALLAELQADLGLAFLFITHDLAVVRAIAHRVAVMRGGRIVELGPADAVLRVPAARLHAGADRIRPRSGSGPAAQGPVASAAATDRRGPPRSRARSLGGAVTIGIAAFGERAGLAVLEGLRAAEAVGRGALHGFVSLVAIGTDGRLFRADIQDGGSAALLAGSRLAGSRLAGSRLAGSSLADEIVNATRAGLMSSGPNRPEPLSQFTPADPAIGLVTGHRFPNAPGTGGRPLNLEILELLRQGYEPAAALSQVIAANPQADAGFIALSGSGRLHAGNTPYLSGFGDAGQAVGYAPDGTAGVAVLHNAIRPHRALAGLVVEVALAVMHREPGTEAAILMKAGLPLIVGGDNAIEVDDACEARWITIRDPRHLSGIWSLGLGYHTPIRRGGQNLGYALYEPYLRAEDGKIATIDGAVARFIAVRLDDDGS